MKKQIMTWFLATIATSLFILSLAGCGAGASAGNNTSNATLTALSITPANPSIAKGTSQQFTATGTYSDNTTKDLTTFVNWSSSAPAVATTSNTGLVTTVGTGATAIFAKDPSTGISGSTNLTVTNFKNGGQLKVARAGSSVLLKDGRVLVTGGIDNNGNGLKSEIYDPLTHTSVVISEMGAPTYNHLSVLLQNGDVLLIDRVWCSIELFQAASQTFKIITEPTPKAYLCGMGRQATMLSDGRVMISGGERYDGQFYDTNNLILLYEPSTQTITYGYMQEYRRDHTATLLPSGNVLICGGRKDQNYHKSCELYDPSTNVSLMMSNGMYYAREGHNAILIGNKVIIIGGCSWQTSVGGKVCGSTEEYDISNNDFKFTFSGSGVDIHGYFPSIIYLPFSDKLYVIGGFSSSGTWEPMVYALDITNKTIQQLESLNDFGGGMSVVQLSSKQFMVTGGYNSDNATYDLVKIFDP